MRINTSIFVFALVLPSLDVLAAERPTDAAIKALVAENLRATQAADLPAILKTIHPESISRTQMAGELEALSAYKLKYEAVSVRFIAMSDNYALIRVVQRTTRLAGPDFRDNEIDGIGALRQDGMAWKYWSQMALALRPLASSAAKSER